LKSSDPHRIANGESQSATSHDGLIQSHIAERWYVYRTQPHREISAADQLKQQGFRPFVPMIQKTVRHARKLRSVRAPLFPSYSFVKLNLRDEPWRSINGTYGVVRLIMANELPIPVPCGVIEQIYSQVDEKGLVRLDGGLSVGQHVEVVNGPFARLMGELVRLDAKGRVQVLLDLMGGKMPVVMDRTDLRVA
jgi:transcription elongation factor/antiterminator RfaH